MKKNLLLLLLLTPFIINTAEHDYRYALRAAIESKDTEKVQSIISQLPKGTIPKVNQIYSLLPENPLFIDTSPAIVKILLDSGVSATEYNPYGNYYYCLPIEYQTDYKSVELILSCGKFEEFYSLDHVINAKKDHRIICALLMAGAKTQRIALFQSFSCFSSLKKLLQKNSSPQDMAWGFLNWAAMTIAADKEEGWKQKLKEIISLYPTPQLEILNPRKIQERQRTGILNIEKLIFQKRYKDAFESWLTS
ncbi:hypothetical protein K9K77_01150 [Candidatus Babeliales bacterium]|nr:hypothetical protein [Candidatus Babeliales bacterium]